METLIKNKIDYERRVKNIISHKLGIEEKQIKPESSFSETFYADFLDIVDIVMELEDAFNISIPADQIEKISTVSEAIDSVKNNGKQRFSNNAIPSHAVLCI